jgi:hypothetical protein
MGEDRMDIKFANEATKRILFFRKRVWGLGVVILCIGIGGSTQTIAAYNTICFSPRAPSFYTSKPSKPICYNDCSQWQIDSYKNQVRNYYSELETYATDVDRYYKKQIEYIECLTDLT